MAQVLNSAKRPGETWVLGIETSCDETAAAVVAREPRGKGRILSSIIRSQWERHHPFGGIVPEIAARAHTDCLDLIIEQAMTAAAADFAALDAVAATAGPGLIGGLIVGLTTAKAISLVHDMPLVAVNHLEAHALTVGLTEGLLPPYLLLLVSGGHTQLVLVEDVARYARLGTTIDDALGEAFDKTAKLLGLGFPGGPEVERMALHGDPRRFALPRPMIGRSDAHFSFAGLKTAVRRQVGELGTITSGDVADLCAGFEAAIVESVSDRVRHGMALAERRPRQETPRHLVVAGGVAANQRLRKALLEVCRARGYAFHVPPAELCTDNAAMVAWAGAERLRRGSADSLDFAARARWPLDPRAAPVLGSGRLGAKA